MNGPLPPSAGGAWPESAAEQQRRAARELCRIGRRFDRRGWVLGTSGNLSARLDGGRQGPPLLVSPSGRHKGRLRPRDLLLVDLAGEPLVPGGPTPSAELAIHLALYRQLPDVRAVLHVHAPFATAVSSLGPGGVDFEDFEMLKGLGASSPFSFLRVPILPNAMDAGLVADATESLDLRGCPGFLVRDHGLYAWGESLEAAERHVEILEFLCHQLWLRR